MRGYPLKVTLAVFLLVFIGRLASSPSLAAAEFTTAYDVAYTVFENGQTEVVQNVTLTNNTNDLYVSDYTLTVGSGEVTNVKASDKKGPITPQVKKGKNQTEIKVTFNDRVVGLGSRLFWTLSYDSGDTASKKGDVWEVIISKLTSQPEISRYTVKIVIPKSLGPELYTSPATAVPTSDSSNYTYTFSKEQFEKTGIMLAFGQSQKFSFKLTYHLKNPYLLPAVTKIALPPDILGLQQIVFKNISSPPSQVELDTDGNYLATYKLKGREEREIYLEGLAFVFHPQRDLLKSGLFSDLPQNLVRAYTQKQKYWETDDPLIKGKAAKLVNREKTVAVNAKNIYDFVASYLSYSPERIKGDLVRLGAKEALGNKEKAVCMEYSDLLITLLRRAGIPARGLEGYAFTENETLRPTVADALHSWVEVYIPKVGWIAVDPTWGSTTGGLDYFTKLDTNHIVFAIKGTSSETPYPAGTYKLSPEQAGDIQVEFYKGTTKADTSPKIKVDFKIPGTAPSGLPFTGKAKVSNLGKETAFGLEIALKGQSEKKYRLGTLPPFGLKEIEFSLRQPNFLKSAKLKIKADTTYQTFAGEIINQEDEANLDFRPLPFTPPAAYLLTALALVLCTISLLWLSLRGVPQRLLSRLLDRLQGQDQ